MLIDVRIGSEPIQQQEGCLAFLLDRVVLMRTGHAIDHTVVAVARLIILPQVARSGVGGRAVDDRGQLRLLFRVILRQRLYMQCRGCVLHDQCVHFLMEVAASTGRQLCQRERQDLFRCCCHSI